MKLDEMLRPLCVSSRQVYLGRGLHTLGLIDWILRQTGAADEIIVTTFSTSVEFLSGFYNLRKRGLVKRAVLVADLKASKKTWKLDSLMDSCFDDVYLAENHSKIVLIDATDERVSVISSQNNTYGGRAECTYIEKGLSLYDTLKSDMERLVSKSLKRK